MPSSPNSTAPKSSKLLSCGRPGLPLASKPTATRMTAWHQQLRDFLTAQGLKYSEQRWKIAELILATGGHLDAQDIVEHVKQKYPEIGAATVYRNIKVLCDAKILKESLNDPHGRVVYELYDDDHHDHLVCLDCGGIFEFHSDKIEALQNNIVLGMRFTQVRHRHVVYARCEFKKNS